MTDHTAHVIAIDGPVASGKTTVGKALAVQLKYRFLDTGGMYRAVTWFAFQRGVSDGDKRELGSLARGLSFQIPGPINYSGSVLLVNGEDLSQVLRISEVNEKVSRVSAVSSVREALVKKQRVLAGGGGIVMVGRDIGTNVLPNASLKIYLDASPEQRAHRRYQERLAEGSNTDYADELRELEKRDKQDQERRMAPLRPADDAVVVLTDGLGVEEVTKLLMKLTGGMRR
jgi:cytidylate kinase